MQEDVTEFDMDDRSFQLKRLEEIKVALAEARETGNWDHVPRDVYQKYLGKVILTSAPALGNHKNFEELDIVSAERFYSIESSDMTQESKGRDSVEELFHQAGQEVLEKLRSRALCSRADAVISVDLKREMLGAESSHVHVLVTATGTAVRLL